MVKNESSCLLKWQDLMNPKICLS